MALGSIEHLQHYFTKTGLIAKKESNAQRKGLVPAIGSLSAHVKANPSLSGLPNSTSPYRPHFSTHLSLHSRLMSRRSRSFRSSNNSGGYAPTVTRDSGLLSANGQAAPSSGFDALRTLKMTTHATRSVRSHLLSLLDEYGHTQPRQVSARYRFPRAKPQKRRAFFSRTDRTDPLARIRRAVLDVLPLLRELEKSARVPLSDDAYDAGSDRRVVLSLRHAGWRMARVDPSLDEAEDEFNVDEENEWLPWQRWDERFIEGIENQRGGVAQYLDIDEVLFCGSRTSGLGIRAGTCDAEGDTRARERALRATGGVREHANMFDSMRDLVMEEPGELQTLVEEDGNGNEGDGDETSGVVEDHLPRWARWSTFPDDPLMHTHVLLVAFLPTSSAQFARSSRSGKPWGYINTDSIQPPNSFHLDNLSDLASSPLLTRNHALRLRIPRGEIVRSLHPNRPSPRHLPRPFDFPPQRLWHKQTPPAATSS
ncbi:hypothetical protein EDB86DRAFT_3087728 [Lactarius hatsudake]|nr:hypothetical protein EDB86DRAFT_3087728 [Lactarius hatsudake]